MGFFDGLVKLPFEVAGTAIDTASDTIKLGGKVVTSTGKIAGNSTKRLVKSVEDIFDFDD